MFGEGSNVLCEGVDFSDSFYGRVRSGHATRRSVNVESCVQTSVASRCSSSREVSSLLGTRSVARGQWSINILYGHLPYQKRKKMFQLEKLLTHFLSTKYKKNCPSMILPLYGSRFFLFSVQKLKLQNNAAIERQVLACILKLK